MCCVWVCASPEPSGVHHMSARKRTKAKSVRYTVGAYSKEGWDCVIRCQVNPLEATFFGTNGIILSSNGATAASKSPIDTGIVTKSDRRTISSTGYILDWFVRILFFNAIRRKGAAEATGNRSCVPEIRRERDKLSAMVDLC